MSKFESSEYLRGRAQELRRLALEHVGQYAQSLRKFAEQLDTKAAQVAARSENDDIHQQQG